MQIGQKQERNFWVNTLLGLIPDSVIGVAVAIITDSGILGFVATVVGLQCVYLLIWIKDTIWQWVFYKIRGKKLMTEYIEDFLKANKFPSPRDFEDSIQGYLMSLVTNEELESDIRIKAAAEIGALQYPANQMRLQETIRLTMAYEEALSNYKKYLDK